MKEIKLEKLCRFETLLGDEIPLGEIGTGYSEIVPVLGGTVTGSISGKVLNFGGDWGLLHSENVNEICTRFLIECEEGAIISVEITGKLLMDYDTMYRKNEDDTADSDDYYFKQAIKFTTGAEKYKWLNNIIAIGSGLITEEGNVVTDVYVVV